MANMKRVLIISYYFPPLGGAGTLRVVKFVKYLPAYGWDPLILTVRDPYYRIYENAAPGDLPPHLSVTRTAAWLPKRWLKRKLIRSNVQVETGAGFGADDVLRGGSLGRWIKGMVYPASCLPDEYAGWAPFALRAGRELIRTRQVDVVLSTSPPNTTHLIGRRLRRSTGVPWAADFRDSWDLFAPWYNPFDWKWRARWDARMERSIMVEADGVIGVSRAMCEDFRVRFPDLSPEKFDVVPNGYDPEDFAEVTPEPLPEACSIVHAGSLYPWRRADDFLTGLQRFLERHPEARSRTGVYFVGQVEADTLRCVTACGVQDVVRCVGMVPHHRSLAYMLGASVLLLLVGTPPHPRQMLTTKLFEYLAARKPILAISGETEAAEVLERLGRPHRVVAPGAVDAVAGALEDLYTLRGAGPPALSTDQMGAAVDRRQSTQALARILDRLVEGRGGAPGP